MEMLRYIRAVARQYERFDPPYAGTKFVYLTDFEALELLEDLRAENPLIPEAALEAALANDDPWSLLGDEVTTVYGLQVRRYGT
jgi:hypothetical protein